MDGTAPVVEFNECDENEMAGIGCRDGSSPILRHNICRRNKSAGIGCDGASPVIVGNQCRENTQAGIGLQGQATAILHRNQCVDNTLVAVGITGNSTAILTQNELTRSGGAPPIIAVKDSSTATIRNNQISGGGVAAVLVQGNVTISDNTFAGIGESQGNAVWIQEGSSAAVSENTFGGYRTAIHATKAAVVIKGNRISRFQGSAIFIKDSPLPVSIVGNTGTSTDPQAKMVEVQGTSGTIENNDLRNE